MGFFAILHSLAHFFTFLLGWQPKDYPNLFPADHSKKSACGNTTIIVGGGVIGSRPPTTLLCLEQRTQRSKTASMLLTLPLISLPVPRVRLLEFWVTMALVLKLQPSGHCRTTCTSSWQPRTMDGGRMDSVVLISIKCSSRGMRRRPFRINHRALRLFQIPVACRHGSSLPATGAIKLLQTIVTWHDCQYIS